MARHLEASGFTVFSTTSPFIAPIIQRERPDVIVMDVDMPMLSGDRIVSIIRGNEFSTLPVIFFSGKPDHILAGMAAKVQPASYCRKTTACRRLCKRSFFPPALTPDEDCFPQILSNIIFDLIIYRYQKSYRYDVVLSNSKR